MVTESELRHLAMLLPNTIAYPHFDRTAFKVARTYVTLAPDGLTANFKFTPDEQEFKCMLLPTAFSIIPNGFGRMGWTTGILANMTRDDLQAALEMAYQHALAKPKTKKTR